MTQFHIFIIRAILGAGFAVILSRMFYPDVNIIYVAGLGIILVGWPISQFIIRNHPGGRFCRDRSPACLMQTSASSD